MSEGHLRSKAARPLTALLALSLAASLPSFQSQAETRPALSKVPVPTTRPAYSPDTLAETVPQSRPTAKELRGTRLTLAEAVFLGIRGNRLIQSAYINRVVEKFDLRIAEDRFTPQLALIGSVARQRIGNVESTEIGASPGVSVLTRTGARFQFGWLNTISSSDGQTLGRSSLDFTLEQPLLRGAGVDVNTAPVEIARLGERVNRLRLKATISEAVSGIILAHRSLIVAQEEVALAQASVGRVESVLQTNRMLIDAGRLPAIDAIQTEADLERQRLRVLSAERNRQQAGLSLLNLLGLDLGSSIVATETLEPRRQELNLTRLLSIALERRPDFQGQLYVLDQTRRGFLVAKNEQLWDISFFANARRDLTFGQSPTSDGSTDLRAGLRFEIPVRDLQRQGLVVQAEATQQSATLQLKEIRAGAEIQIRNSVSEINILWQQISVAKRSLDLARQSVEVELLKLNVGRSSSFSVSVLENNLREAEIQLLMSRVDYMNALSQLDLALGTTLDTWQIVLRD